MERGPSLLRRPVVLFATGLAVVFVLWAAGIALPLIGGYPSVFDWLRDRSITAHPTKPESFDRQPLLGALRDRGLGLGAPAYLRIYKRERLLEVWLKAPGGRYDLFKSYPICNFSGDLGPKLAEGDKQAPEGFYRIAARQLNPHSRHHLAFNLGFPNAFDTQHARTGSYLMVHGGCTSVGCFAMTDAQIDEIYALVEAAIRGGQPEVDVSIFPFRLTEAALTEEAASRWLPFWQNLKQGADLFDATGVPPAVGACDGRYVFGDDAVQAGCTPISGWA